MSIKTIEQLNRTCLSKKSYTKETAENAVDRFMMSNEIIYYYKCQLCARYHLTRMQPKEYNEEENYKII